MINSAVKQCTGCPITHDMGFIVKNPSKRSTVLKHQQYIFPGKRRTNQCSINEIIQFWGRWYF
jgi:hypothetical protein